MNDRAVSLLDNYEIEVLRTRKGRGAILCDTGQGTYIFKEYKGPKDKVILQNALLTHIQEQASVCVESIVPTKEGEFLVSDQDGISYILKSYFEGRECNIRDIEECKEAVSTLAILHTVMHLTGQESIDSMPVFYLEKEYEKHNRELKKVRRYLKDRGQKTDFELFLQKHYDYFLEQALQITEEWQSYTCPKEQEELKAGGIFSHGDYQYHNIIKTENDMCVINFEKCILDKPIRDLSLFMRKLLEKSNWSRPLGDTLLNSYQKVNPLSARLYIELYYRLAYPEKFWKIVNFYYNSGKAWIPGRNMEKLEKLLIQEKEKQTFLTEIFRNVHSTATMNLQ